MLRDVRRLQFDGHDFIVGRAADIGEQAELLPDTAASRAISVRLLERQAMGHRAEAAIGVVSLR